MTRRGPFWAALTAAAWLIGAAAHAQPAALGLAPESALLRWDPAIRYGQLPNGLRYAVQRNATPKGGVSLRLGCAVGSYDEADDEPGGAAAVGLLLGEEVGLVAHGVGLVVERSTVGTARSVSSVICHSSAGEALARPATSMVGKVACRVLYCVATSL